MNILASKYKKNPILNYKFYLIIVLFLSWIYFLFLPFHEDLVLFGTSIVAQKASSLDYLNNIIHGRLILQKYIFYFFHIMSANFLENKNLYQIAFRGFYSLVLITAGFVYSKLFCDYNNKLKNAKYDFFIIFFIFCFIFFISPQRISLSSEEICAAISLAAFAFFLSRNIFLIFFSGLFIGLTFFFKAATIFIGFASFGLILYEFYSNRLLQKKKILFYLFLVFYFQEFFYYFI